MVRSKMYFFLVVLITAVTFVTGLEVEEVSPEEKPAIEREFIRAAQKLVELGKIEEAIEIYERIVQAVPDDLESRVQLAKLYSTTKQYEKAAQTWGKLLETDPENTKYQDGLVYSLRVAGKGNEALEIGQTYVQTYPEGGVHYLRLARLYEVEGKVDLAIANYKKAIELAPGDVKVQTYLKLANHYFFNEDIAAAEKILKNAMLYTQSEFDRRDIELQLIKLYLYQGNLEEVLQKIENEDIPLSYEISNPKERARHFLNTGELEKSAAYYKIALVMSNNSHERDTIFNELLNEYLNELLNEYLKQGRTDSALAFYEVEASKQFRSTILSTLLSPSNIEVKFGSDDARKILMNSFKDQGKLDVLRTLLEDKLEKNADNPAIIEMLAEIYWNTNDYQKATEAYHLLSKVEPNNIRCFYLAATAFQKNNQPDMAKELLNQAEAKLAFINYKQDGVFLGALATICLKNQMYDPAIKLAGKAIVEAQNFVDPDIEFIRKAIIEAQNFVDPTIERVGNAAIEAQNSNHTLVVNACLRILWKSRIGLAKYYDRNNMPDKAMEQMLQTGIIHENVWMVLGPFDNTAGIGYNTEYIPEDIAQINLTAKYEGVDEQISWEKFTDSVYDGFIDLGSNNNWRVSYAYATVTSPDDREVFFRFSSDDQSKIWLNGTEVFSDTNAKTAILDRNTIPITLKAGKNTVLVKVCNQEMSWGFYLRVTDADGVPFEDLQINDVPKY